MLNHARRSFAHGLMFSRNQVRCEMSKQLPGTSCCLMSGTALPWLPFHSDHVRGRWPATSIVVTSVQPVVNASSKIYVTAITIIRRVSCYHAPCSTWFGLSTVSPYEVNRPLFRGELLKTNLRQQFSLKHGMTALKTRIWSPTCQLVAATLNESVSVHQRHRSVQLVAAFAFCIVERNTFDNSSYRASQHLSLSVSTSVVELPSLSPSSSTVQVFKQVTGWSSFNEFFDLLAYVATFAAPVTIMGDFNLHIDDAFYHSTSVHSFMTYSNVCSSPCCLMTSLLRSASDGH